MISIANKSEPKIHYGVDFFEKPYYHIKQRFLEKQENSKERINMFAELASSSTEFNLWSLNPLTIGAVLGVFVLYPFMIWRDGNRETAAYFLDPVSFEGPFQHYLSLHIKRQPVKSVWALLLGHAAGLFHAFVFGVIIFGYILLCLFAIFGWGGVR